MENIATTASGITERRLPTMEDHILAKLAVTHGFVPEEKVLEAIRQQELQRKQGQSLGLADILIARGFITEKNLGLLEMASTFQKMREPDRVFGQVLTKKSLATQDQVDKASRIQARYFKEQRRYRSMGEILVELGTITQKQCMAVHAAVERIRAARANSGPSQDQGATQVHQQQPEQVCAPNPATDVIPCEEDTSSDWDVLLEEDSFDILASRDGLKACFRFKTETPKPMRCDEIMGFLNQVGICEGILGGEVLERHFTEVGPVNRLRVFAEGTPPNPGASAEIRFLYENGERGCDPQTDNCVIDLKNRGLIAQVRKGDLIAEMTPQTMGANGIDVYGKIITPPTAPEKSLICGAGVERSPDGLRFHAKIDGRPQVSPYGTLSVLPELIIEEDVSFETGNVTFDGRLEVRGVIQDGFRVECDQLSVREISKAHVQVNGDIVVSGGILGATIKSKGSVRAAHIHASRIEALGDIVVDKGILESKVITSGKCLAPRGKIIYSQIFAKQGIEAGHIGSDRSEPCGLNIGFDPISEREIEAMKEAIATREKDMQIEEEAICRLNDQVLKLESRIGTMAQVQDRSSLQLGNLAREAQELAASGDREGAEERERMVLDLEEKIRKAEEELNKLFRDQDDAREKIASHQTGVEEIQQEIQGLVEELDALTSWVSSNNKPPAIKVSGIVYSGTSIKGPFSSTVLNSNFQRVLIRECSSRDRQEGAGNVSKRIMKVYNLS